MLVHATVHALSSADAHGRAGAKIAPSPELLATVRDRYPDVEPAFRAATGYGFDALTQSEARYLAKHKSPESVRDRISAAGEQASAGVDDGAVGQGQVGLSSGEGAPDRAQEKAPAGQSGEQVIPDSSRPFAGAVPDESGMASVGQTVRRRKHLARPRWQMRSTRHRPTPCAPSTSSGASTSRFLRLSRSLQKLNPTLTNRRLLRRPAVPILGVQE